MFRVISSLALVAKVAGRPYPHADVPASPLRAVEISSHDQKLLRREAGAALVETRQNTLTSLTAQCDNEQVAYAMLTDGSLAVIDMGPNTPSGKTEVHRLKSATGSNNFKQFKETNPIQTRLHLTAESNANGDWIFLSDGDDDLVAINDGLTESGKTEVIRLKYDSSNPWSAIDVHLETALPLRQTGKEFEYLLDSNDNLVVIEKGSTSSPTTDGRTSIKKLDAAAGYQSYVTGFDDLATGLPYSGSTSGNGDWAFLMDGQDRLICIKLPSSSTSGIRVKRLTSGSNYNSFDLEPDEDVSLPTSTYNCDSSCDNAAVHWVFEMDASDNIIAIKEGALTSNAKTEIHRLTAASNYTSWDTTVAQTNSAAACRKNPHFNAAGSSR